MQLNRRNLNPTGRTRTTWTFVGLVVALALLGGCDTRSEAPSARATVPPGSVVVSGVVSLAGPAPVMKDIPGSACHPGGPPVKEDWAIVDSAGHLANVVVFIDNGPPVDVPEQPVVLDQVGCQYQPHVVAVRTGQTLRIRSSDPTLHNVHAVTTRNAPFNFGMIGSEQTHDVTFSQPEFLKLQCDVHPWMSARVAVFDHPLFAVTKPDGTFEIRHIPPGTYTLVAWHERFGRLARQITISDHVQPSDDHVQPSDDHVQPVKVNLTYDPVGKGP